MKLLTKTTLHIATLSLFLFFVMGIIFFQLLKHFSISELDQELIELREVVDHRLDRGWQPESVSPEIPGIDRIEVRSGRYGRGVFRGDTLLYDSAGNRHRTYRMLRYGKEADGEPVEVTIYKSTTPTDQLVERVTLMMTLMVILFLAGIFILNRFLFGTLWKDFFRALEKLKAFETTKEPVVLGEQDIDEFNELNRVLERMTRRLAREYKELKEYTDHTTHELQTPLAVIQSRMELLMQSEHLGEEEMRLIESVNSSVNHLSRLNSTLALITRIENQQFTEVRPVPIREVVIHHLEMLSELAGLRGIEMIRRLEERGPVVEMDRGLADILVTNLLNNAIVHNREGGRLEAEVTEQLLRVSNEGPPLPFGESELFGRFIRGSQQEGNFGLGLSLVKKICDSCGFRIRYRYEDSEHVFEIDFLPATP